MAFKNQSIIAVLQEVVDSLRTTGTFTGVYLNGITTCTCENSLKAREVVYINDAPYLVHEATDTYFTVKSDLSSYTSYTTGYPYFEYGHMVEIANTLTERDKASLVYKFQKYPAIFLKLDTPSKPNIRTGQFDYTNITLYLVNATEQTYKAADRLDNNFNPILYPLYEKLITALQRHEAVIPTSDLTNLEHDKYDRFFWGTQLNKNSTNNILNDYLDAIEVTNLKLSIKQKNCI